MSWAIKAADTDADGWNILRGDALEESVRTSCGGTGNYYSAEYAASGRSTCKEFRCKQKIPAGALRIGICNDHGGDCWGSNFGYYCPACIWRTFSYKRGGLPRIRSLGQMVGVKNLEPTDRAVLQKLIDEGPGAATTTPEARQNMQQKNMAKATTQTASNTEGKVFLICPFEEKDEAKALGAKWDWATKLRYITADLDFTTFAKWLPPGSTPAVEACDSDSDDSETENDGESPSATATTAEAPLAVEKNEAEVVVAEVKNEAEVAIKDEDEAVVAVVAKQVAATKPVVGTKRELDEVEGELDEKSLKKLRVPELRQELESRGLDTKGRKAELITRLVESQ